MTHKHADEIEKLQKQIKNLKEEVQLLKKASEEDKATIKKR